MIRLNLLGSIEMEGPDGREARSVLAQTKRLAIFAYLAVSPGTFHRRDTLLALFWPDLDQARARGALNQALRFLRRELSPRAIVSRGDDEVCVEVSEVWCDVVALRRHIEAAEPAEALTLYRGEFLRGLHLGDCHAFDEWLEKERFALKQMTAIAARSVAESREASGNFTTAIATARRAVELSADDERVVRELLLMLERLGDRAGALHAYEDFATRLANEFGATPSVQTIDVVQRIRSRATTPTVSSADQPRWEIVRELGRGGTSTVFLARDSKHDRFVAVKTLKPELARRGIERFLREIQITARLAHPHILPLIDSGVVDGQLQLVTPYVAGESLRDRLRRDPRLTLDEALQLGVEIADALDYAHRLGVVHRDIKPENILLADGHAIVADFGVARALASLGASTIPDSDPSAIVGSRAYMSPEQSAGSPDSGPRADVYALGVVLYEMLIGSLPAPSVTGAEIIRRRADVPTVVASMVASCLETRAADRPAASADVLRSLRAVMRGTAGARARSPWMVWSTIAASVIALMGLAALHRPGGNPKERLAVTETHLVAGSTDMELDPAISPDGKLVAYATGRTFRQMRIVVRSLDGGPPTVVSGALGGAHRWPRWSPDGSRLLFAAWGHDIRPGGYVVSAKGGMPQLIIRNERSPTYEQAQDPVGGLGVVTPAWSSDGKRLVYSLSDRIVVRDVDGSAETVIATGPQLHSPALSPDGRHVAYVAGNGWGVSIFNLAASSVCIAAVTERTPPTCIPDRRHSNRSPRWLRDGRTLLYVSNVAGEGDVYQQGLTASMKPIGEPVRVTTGLAAASIDLAADQRRAVYSVVRLRSRIWAAPMGNSVASLSSLVPISNDGEAIEGLDVSPDGNRLAFDSDRDGVQNLYTMPVGGGPPTPLLLSDSGPNLLPRWSPDGRSILYYTLRHGNRDVHIVAADGARDEVVTSGPLEEGVASWSPNGNDLAFWTGWGSPTGVYLSSRISPRQWSTPRRLALGGDSVGGPPSWSPDGRWIAYPRQDGLSEIYLVPATGGRPRAIVTGSMLGERPGPIVWGSDAKTVYVRGEKDGVASFWQVRIDGGPPRLLLRLDDSTHVSRRAEFATDGRRLYFTLSSDLADVWMMNLKPGS